MIKKWFSYKKTLIFPKEKKKKARSSNKLSTQDLSPDL